MAEIVVFAQSPDARVDLDAWRRRAKEFFGATLTGTPKRYVIEYPKEDSVEVVIDGEPRTLRARPATEIDYAAADEADAKRGYTGLATLAHRCKTVWIVDGEDRVALLLAAVVASILLGPILVQGDLLGVRTARERLNA